MSLTRAFCHELGAPPLLGMGPIVFVVDDDISVRESLELLIRCEGWQPETFSSGQEFLTRPRTLVPSCLVLDFSLPGLNGLELQKRIAVERTDMPIIFITGYRDVPMTVQAMKAGAVEFLTKPFSEDVLLSAIRGALERSRVALSLEAEMQGAPGPLRLTFRREQQVMALVVSGLLNKQDWWGTRYQRNHSEGSPRQGNAEDAGRFPCWPGENGREAPARTSSDGRGLTAVFKADESMKAVLTLELANLVAAQMEVRTWPTRPNRMMFHWTVQLQRPLWNRSSARKSCTAAHRVRPIMKRRTRPS